MKVMVYFNLHRKLWSIKAMEGPDKGRVIDHAEAVELVNVTPKVSEAGRQRVIREGRKNVHAGLVGHLVASGSMAVFGMYPAFTLAYEGADRVTYNPRKTETFVKVDDRGEAMGWAQSALLLADRSVRCLGLETYSIQESKQLDLFAA